VTGTPDSYSGRLEHRFALVTGAGGGLGSAISELFAKEGAVVAVNDLNEESAEMVAQRCRQSSPSSEAVVADVSDAASVSEMFGHLESRWGRLDILVNNAGVSSTSDVPAAPRAVASPLDRGIDDITDAQWHRMIGVHLNGTFYCTRAAVPLMKRNGRGSIICMSSIAGLSGIGPIHYSAAKGGILGMIRSLARNVGPSGLRVNAICPGVIDAGMSKAHAPDVRESVVLSIPMRRLGSADDVAHAALYLASDESAYTTGQCLSPNGGLVIL
jgi:3-oxoacyl-[acyl-carrier protein] reductase